ncbi:MAG: CoA-binding protein [Candidatus Kapabacteria bacterium]|nr:CoA-binding protein [Ignavibacteriota bacterium]MCW5885388.1 CoA-binding protein [Candidatus Kapabacteria bacterium]
MSIEEIFDNYNTIAVYGMSKQPYKPSHTVPLFMKKQGYNVIPINPTTGQISNLTAYKNIADIPEEIDILNVFRPSEVALDVIKEAVERKNTRGDIKVIWLQQDIVSPEGKLLAEANGIEYIEDKCMYREYIILSK